MYVQAAANDPVLYIGLYSTGDAPSEVDDYHWVFIVGPSHEEAGSQGTLYSMEPLHHKEWYWSYNQCIVPLQDLSALLVRLMVAEVVDMDMLQMAMLRSAEKVRMRMQAEWMSVRWVQRVLKSLEEDGGCLGKKMKSFESVEAEGRRLAEMEDKTRNVDLAIRCPVLYAAVHRDYPPPCANDESYWTFLSGPANKTAESERAGHAVDMQLDSGGRPIWGYSQTAIPLSDVDDLRVRILIADIAKLGLLAKMARDQDITPRVDRTTFAGNLKSKTFLRIQEKIEALEGQPDCFSFKYLKSSMCEEVLDEEMTSNQPGAKPWWPSRPGCKTFCLLRASKMPDHDAAEIVVNLSLSQLEPITMSVAIDIITSVLGAAAMALRRQNAARERLEKKSKRKCEPIAEPEEIAVGNSWFPRVQRRRLDQEKIIAEKEAERQRAPTWFSVAAKECEDEHSRGEDETEEEEKLEEEEGGDEKEAELEEERKEEKEEEQEEEEAEDEIDVEADDDDDEDEDRDGGSEDSSEEEEQEEEEVEDEIDAEADDDDDDNKDEDEDEDRDGDSKDSSEEDDEDDEDDDEHEGDSNSDDEDDDDDEND